MKETINIANIEITFSNLNKLVKMIEKEKSGYYLFVNINTIVESKNNNFLSKSIHNSSANIPDGFPLALVARLKGIKDAKRIAGPDFTLELIKLLEKQKCAFYGGNEEQNKERISKLKKLFPKLKFISFPENKEKETINNTNKQKIKYLFVSIGSPKQEIWAYENYKKINSKILCVGIAIPYILGDYKRAPKFMQKLYLEWLYRLITEPKKSWKRYLINGPRFAFIALNEIFNK